MTIKIKIILAMMPITLLLPTIGVTQELEFERKGPADTVLEYRNSSPEHYGHQEPAEMDEGASPIEYDVGGFSPDPVYDAPYDAE